jgi:hypothetical protein
MSDPDIYRRLERLERWRDEMASVEALLLGGQSLENSTLAKTGAGLATINAASAFALELAEGSWTPTMGGTSSNPTGIAYSVQTGLYVRLGRLVTCWGRLIVSALSAAGTGAITIDGLPFASFADGNILGNVSLSYVANVDNAAGVVQLMGYVEANDATPRAILVESIDNAAPDTNGAARVAVGDDLVFMITYAST